MGVSARLGIAIALAGGIACSGATPGSASAPAAAVAATARGGTLRLAGTVEATRAQSVLVPRLAGQTAPTLVITRLARAGSKVESGEMIIEFDPQERHTVTASSATRLLIVLSPWPGDGHPGAMSLADKGEAREKAAERRA